MSDWGSTTGWVATHVVTVAGRAWATPDGTQQPSGDVAEGLEVCWLQTLGAWAQVSFSNGWVGWIDGRTITPLAPTPPPPPPQQSAPNQQPQQYQQPQQPYRQPQQYQQPVAQAQQYAQPLQYTPPPAGASAVEQLRHEMKTPGVRPAISPVALIGAGLTLLGTVLPWLSAGGLSVSAWNIPLFGLFTGRPTLSGFSTGLALLVVVLVALPFRTHRPLPRWVMLLIGSFPVEFAFLAWRQGARGGAGVGFGLILAFLGGILISYEFILLRLLQNKGVFK